jgi:two-component system sensor histidine kinase KdpD
VPKAQRITEFDDAAQFRTPAHLATTPNSKAVEVNSLSVSETLDDHGYAHLTAPADPDIRPTLVAAVSHDLRAPLATATMAVETLADPDGLWTFADRVTLVEVARSSLAQMSRLVDGLLDSARIQHRADTIRLVPAELGDVVHAAVASVPEADCLAIDLPTQPVRVVTDPVLLERVIANIVGNALRFSPPDSCPGLVVSRGRTWIEMRIVDHGPGVAPDRHHQMFQPFTRLDCADSENGLGLGLAIARTLANAIGVEIRAETTAGGGLTIVIAIPLSD